MVLFNKTNLVVLETPVKCLGFCEERSCREEKAKSWRDGSALRAVFTTKNERIEDHSSKAVFRHHRGGMDLLNG